MNKVSITMAPVLINRQNVQDLLSGISRTTFWRKRQAWAKAGTPFPDPAPGTHPAKGGEQYRYTDVIKFLESQGLVDLKQT